jgi:hypothetical protein
MGGVTNLDDDNLGVELQVLSDHNSEVELEFFDDH